MDGRRHAQLELAATAALSSRELACKYLLGRPSGHTSAVRSMRVNLRTRANRHNRPRSIPRIRIDYRQMWSTRGSPELR